MRVPVSGLAAAPSVAMFVAMFVAITACNTGTSGGSATDPADAGEPQPGGTLEYALSQVPSCPDPQQAGQNMAIYVARQVVDSLTDQDPETGELVPWLATSWEVNDDATEFTFELRDDVTYSDGTSLDAGSVQRNFDAIVHDLGAAATLAGDYLAGYVETRVEDTHVATVVFEEPNAQFLQATATHSLGLVADATLELEAAERCQGEVIGSGPFVFESYVAEQEAVLARRDGYAWGSELFEHTGEAYLDGIAFTVVPESGVRSGSLASGQVDASSDVLPQDMPVVEGAGGVVHTRANPGVVFNLQTNLSRDPLREEPVRQALQLAIDRQEVVEAALGDSFDPATSVLGRATPGWVDLAQQLRYDPAAAKGLLDEAGWTPDADGIRTKGGEPLRVDVVFAENFDGSQAALELVQQQLRQVGIDFQLRLVSPAEFTELSDSGDYDTLFGNLTRADPDILRTLFSAHLQNRNLREPDAEVEPLLEEQLAATDDDERFDLVADAQRLIVERGYSIPIFELSQSIGTASHVHGLAFDASARLQFYDTWLDEEGR